MMTMMRALYLPRSVGSYMTTNLSPMWAQRARMASLANVRECLEEAVRLLRPLPASTSGMCPFKISFDDFA
jgi:hypothetical protein